MKKTAGLWLMAFSLAVFISSFFQNQIEAHSLQNVLHWGQDAFGRNCIALTLSAALESFKAIVPVGLLCLGSSLVASSFTLTNNPRIAFLTRAALDTVSSLPGFLIALAISVFFPNSPFIFFLASLLIVFPNLTRFWESHLTKMKTEEYIRAAVALGASPFHLFFKQYLPELGRLLIAIFPFLLTRLLLIETSLSFIGLGRAPTHESWGRLLYQGKDYLIEAPWILGAAAIPLCLTLFSFHLLTHSDPN